MGILSIFSLELRLATLASLVAYVLVKRWLAQRGSDLKRMKRVDGGHWLWGDERDAWSTIDGQFYIQNIKSLGQAFVMKGALFHPDILAITDPAAVSHIYTRRPYDYLKSQVIRPLIDRVLGKGLVWAEGEEHRRARQMLAPVFTNENIKRMDEEIYNATDKLVDMLRDHIHARDKVAGPDGVRLNILEWTCRATLDIIGKVGFDHDFKCGESEEAKVIGESWRQLVSLGMEFPGFVAPLVVRAFPFITDLPVPAIQAQGEIKTMIKKLAVEIVENRRVVQGDEIVKKGKDLLSTLMRMNEKQGQDFDQLLDHICTFVMVGHETTSAAVNYSLWCLAKSKSMQNRLRKELEDFVGSGLGGEPTYEEFQTKLPYLDAVCKEALRMYPPASHTERVAQRDDVLPLHFPIQTADGEELTSIRIRKGQLIMVPTIAINRNYAVYGPDAEEFKPERWLEGTKQPASDTLTQGWNGIFTFIEGPRLCIGYRLAIFEYKVMMSALLRNFEFSDTGEKVVTQFSSTLQPYVDGRKSEGVQIPLFVKDLQA